MEHSLSSLAFKGTIVEAITEAKQQKKLFVVYNSGDNSESEHLETSTWNNVNVAEAVSKYCVLLHISEGSADAANFSAIYDGFEQKKQILKNDALTAAEEEHIKYALWAHTAIYVSDFTHCYGDYPQLPAPCITVIGYNGVQVLQNEGYVTADFLASNLEKAWFSLQIQESAAAFFVDAIASKKEAASGISNKASLEQGSSSTNQASPPSDRGILCSDSMSPEATEVIMKDDDECVIEDQNSTIYNEPSPSSDLPENTKAKLIDGYASMTKKSEESSKVESAYLKNRDGECVGVKDNPESSNHDNVAKNASFQETDKEAQESTEFDKDENDGVEKASDFNLPNKSNDVLLNIRLPDGSSLQVKLPMVDTLEMVKNYVDNNRPTGFGAYDLAIPYPRHVFSDQDLCKQLSELGLSNRQALVVVLRRPTNSHPKGVSSRAASNYAGSSSASNEGKWALLKRMLSYVNPLSYLAGAPSSTNSGQETQSGMLQYGPNSSLQGNTRGAGRPGSVPSNEQASTSGTSSNKKPRQPSSNQFGSNIHILKRDEDDPRFSDRNTFWNGNSTQFGGDDNGK